MQYFFLIILLSCLKGLKGEEEETLMLYGNEICSYNGSPELGKDNEGKAIVKCNCRPGYWSLTPAKKKIRGEDVKCSYEKKKRFIAFFFAAFIPLGFDYLYLGRYWIFIIILCFDLFIMINSAVCFFYTNKFKGEPNNVNSTKHKDRLDSQRDSEKINTNNFNMVKEESENNRERSAQIYQTLNFILAGIWVIMWIVDIIIMGLGTVTDAKGIETVNDLKFLFKVKRD